MSILSFFGLMKRSEHELAVRHDRDMLDQYRDACDNYNETIGRLTRESNDWQVKFVTATKDLAEQSDEIAALKADFNQRLADAVQDYQSDALAMRKKRKDDTDRAQAKRDAAKAAAAKPKSAFTKPIPEPVASKKAVR